MLDRPALLNVSRSATGRRWLGPSADVERRGLAISQIGGLSALMGVVLAGRGVEPETVGAWLAPTLRDLLPDPSIFRDMDAAADRLAKAALRGEAVAVFGDYDVDGACASAMLKRWLRHFGLEATVHIPDRIDEGYGPNVPAMTALAKAHDLILCVDCGSLSFEPITAARAAGAEVIVVDHHLCLDDLPADCAVVNPNRRDETAGHGTLCAAGMVFLLLVAANRLLRAEGRAVPDLMAMLDMVALATVADVAPLTGLNRAFVRQGLTVMGHRRNPGLRALADVARLDGRPGAFHLGFLLGPRINAGGRVGQADLGTRLLATDNSAEAEAIALQLDALNRERQAVEARVLAEAMAQVEERGADGPLVWAAGEGWHPGVVGIVASRLKERFGRPAVVIALGDGVGTGSGRSIPGVDLGSSVAALAAGGVLRKGGGHAMAAGLTVETARLGEAMAALAGALARQGAGAGEAAALPLDGCLSIAGATPELAEILEAAGPWGAGAPAPRFAIANARLSHVAPVGQRHLRLRLGDGRATLEAIAFGAANNPLGDFLESHVGARIHVAGQIDLDTWGGRRRAKLRLDDAAAADGP
jgi:single-stranded-DNA-specific exonuclease